jgi:hypothetical protein
MSDEEEVLKQEIRICMDYAGVTEMECHGYRKAIIHPNKGLIFKRAGEGPYGSPGKMVRCEPSTSDLEFLLSRGKGLCKDKILKDWLDKQCEDMINGSKD